MTEREGGRRFLDKKGALIPVRIRVLFFYAGSEEDAKLETFYDGQANLFFLLMAAGIYLCKAWIPQFAGAIGLGV